MNTQPSPRIVGAFIIGFALVGGAYVVSNFGKAPAVPQLAQTGSENQAAVVRTAIPVTDEDENGIQDWRDEFLNPEPVVIRNKTSEGYELPETITGRLGISFIQDVTLSKKADGSRTYSDEQIVAKNISQFESETLVRIYDTPDIKLLRSTSDETIRKYANTLATTIMENNETDLEYEILILQDALNRKDKGRIDDLSTLAEVYRLTRDAVVDIPVPQKFAKEHLDLINGLHAVHHDIKAMTYAFDDPAYSLLRLKRYEGDILGMIQALENMYLALEPHANLFTAEDSAVFFVEFSPNNNVRI